MISSSCLNHLKHFSELRTYVKLLLYGSRQIHFSVTSARRKYSVFNFISGYEEITCVQLTAKNAGGNYEVYLDPLLSFSNMRRETNMAPLIGEFFANNRLEVSKIEFCLAKVAIDRLCGLVVRVSGYRYRGPGFDPRRYQIF